MSDKPVVLLMCYSSNNGGMELDTIKLAGLLSGSCDVTVMCKQGEFIHKRLEKQVLIKYIPVNFHSRTFSLSMLFSVREAIRRTGAKNIIFFGASELKTLYFSFLGFHLNVIVRHGTTKSRQKNGLIHRMVYSCVNHHVALSEHLLKNVKYIVPHTSGVDFIKIFPSYEMTDTRSSTVDKHDKLIITHVGRLAKGKGQVEALKACKKLYDEGIDFQLNIVGPDTHDGYAEDISQFIAQSRFSDKVKLTGYVEDTISILRQSDIFLFPSYGEGMPNAFLEALYCGVPCLAFANTVFPEFLSMGFHVTLAKDRNVAELTNKLLLLINKLDKEKEVSAKNIPLARKYFTTQTELTNWKKILI